MEPGEQKLVRTIEEIVQKADPGSCPRPTTGPPAWTRDGKVLCFGQPASSSRCGTFPWASRTGEPRHDGNFWPSAYAIPGELTADDVKRLTAIIEKGGRLGHLRRDRYRRVSRNVSAGRWLNDSVSDATAEADAWTTYHERREVAVDATPGATSRW
ncbi:MAG: hypothetical protein R2717_02425 [Schumannella sp.]